MTRLLCSTLLAASMAFAVSSPAAAFDETVFASVDGFVAGVMDAQGGGYMQVTGTVLGESAPRTLDLLYAPVAACQGVLSLAIAHPGVYRVRIVSTGAQRYRCGISRAQ